MTSLILAFIVALLASIVPLAVFGLSWQTALAIWLLALILWPIIALMRRIMGWLYRLLTGRAP